MAAPRISRSDEYRAGVLRLLDCPREDLCGRYPEGHVRGPRRGLGADHQRAGTARSARSGQEGINNTPIANPGFIPPNDVYTRLPIDLHPPPSCPLRHP